LYASPGRDVIRPGQYRRQALSPAHTAEPLLQLSLLLQQQRPSIDSILSKVSVFENYTFRIIRLEAYIPEVCSQNVDWGGLSRIFLLILLSLSKYIARKQLSCLT
jgi:hypothetical protein